MDEYFGKRALGSDEIYGDGDGDEEDEDHEEDEEDEEGKERVEVETAEEKSDPAYPRPTLSVAVRPTRPRLSGHHLISTYGAIDLISSLTRFLKPLAREAGLKPVVLPSDTFDTWHKITLCHELASFAPNEPLHRDAIRIRPPSLDENGRRLPGLFNTALFLYQPQAVGIHRYRVGRVRAIFTLPPRLRSIYSGHLVYLELFTPFKHSVSPVHRLHTISHDLREGQRRGLVIPMERLALACHLGPIFSHIDPTTVLHSTTDLLSLFRHFVLNPCFNSYSHSFFRYHRNVGGA